jgi:hypothetical protein
MHTSGPLRRLVRTRAGAVGAVGLALSVAAVALPASAAALSTSVVSASATGPYAAMTEGDASAACSGRLVSGGGARVDQSILSNGTHLAGSFPTPDAIGQSADADVSPTAWIGAGAIGGQATTGVTTWAYAICLDAGPGSTRVSVASTPGPSATFTGALAVATCPAGTRLLSGGARTTPGTVGSLKPNGSFPSDASGNPVVAGANPQSWTAAGLNGGQPPNANTTHGFAICATAGAANPAVTVQNARIDGPGDASTGGEATTTCPAGTVLLGGGGYISDHFALPGSQGDHLTGSFPSDANGTPITSGAASSWTASSHIGGTVSGPLTDTNVWAMCAGTPSGGAAGGGSGGGAGGGGGGGGGNLPPPTIKPIGPIAGGITTAQILQSVRRQMIPKGNAARLSEIRKNDGAKLEFKALDAGKLLIRWLTPATSGRKKLKQTVVAQGRQTFARSGTRTISVKLTTAGKRLLHGATRVRLVAEGTFTAKGRKPILGTKQFVLTRKAATVAP